MSALPPFFLQFARLALVSLVNELVWSFAATSATGAASGFAAFEVQDEKEQNPLWIYKQESKFISSDSGPENRNKNYGSIERLN